MPGRFLRLDELAEGDTVSTEEELRRRDFVYFERTAEQSVATHLVPRGTLLLVRHDDPWTIAVLSSPDAFRAVPEAPIYEMDLWEMPQEDEGTISIQLIHRPVHITDDPMASRVAHLRAALPKFPRSQANPVPLPSSSPLSDYYFYYRDCVDLGPLADAYEPGRVLLENGFVDATALRGGPVGPIRFLIISCEGADMEALEPDGSGLVTLLCEARFLVVDNYAPAGELRQIALLHVPSRALLSKFLGDLDHETMECLQSAARADFDALRQASPVTASLSPDWRKRVADPLGVDAEGQLVLDMWHQLPT